MPWVPQAGTKTSAQGEYRLTNLYPGQYRLLAGCEGKPLREITNQREMLEAEPLFKDVRTFYPHARSALEAVPLDVKSGSSLNAVDIRVRREKTTCFVSRILEIDSRNEELLEVSLLREGYGDAIATGAFLPGKFFGSCGLAEGEYRIEAYPRNAAGRKRYGSVAFSVSETRLRAPEVRLQPFLSVHGTVLIDEDPPAGKMPGIGVSLTPFGRTRLRTEQLSAVVDKDGSFDIPKVALGLCLLNVRVAGYYVSAATQGGRDALREPFPAGSGDLRITLRSDGARLNVRVVDSAGLPVSTGFAVLGKEAPNGQPAPHELRSAMLDQDGHALFDSLAPGKYRLLALRDLADEGLAHDSDFYSLYAPTGKQIELDARESESVEILASSVEL
jgi:hypothetical protein